MRIIKIINKLLFIKKSASNSLINRLLKDNKIIIGKETSFDNMRVDIRGNEITKKYLKCGSECVLNGTFIFENQKGYISIGDRTFIGGGKFISIKEINIGDDVLISWGCTFMDNNAHPLQWSLRKNDVLDWKKGLQENKIGYYKDWKNVISDRIIVKNKAWIGFEVVVLKGVTIGEGAIIGSRSVVTKDVPDWTIVAGNPAKIVREIPKNAR